MREIKFRAWDGKNIKHVTILHLVGDEPGDIQTSGGEWLNGKDVFLMQFTGLKDKDGKEIYEGDLVVIRDPDKTSKPFEIIWERDAWMLCRNGTSLFSLGTPSMDVTEVIGNIYENSELLNASTSDPSTLN
jgi:uncharacterized phage protein (TIGR01671 family)